MLHCFDKLLLWHVNWLWLYFLFAIPFVLVNLFRYVSYSSILSKLFFLEDYETFYFFVDIDLTNPLVSHGLDFTFISLRDNFLNGAWRNVIQYL